MVAVLAALALALGPPSPVLHSGGEQLTAARGSFCWRSPGEDGTQRAVCVDTLAPVTEDSLRVRRRGRLRIDMRTNTSSLHVTLRGHDRRLRVRRAGESRQRFVVRLPQRFGQQPVLDLFARYPQGDGFFGARLRLP